MHISYHIGAHATDNGQLLRSLLKNKGILAKEGVVVPGPGRYRKVIAEVLVKLNGGKASPETQDVLLETIMDQDDAERLVLDHDNFLGVSRRALEHGQFYHLATDRVTRLRNLFPDSPVEFFIGIQNVATFIPAIFEENGGQDFVGFMKGVNPMDLFWSDGIGAIRDAVPDCPITVG